MEYMICTGCKRPVPEYKWTSMKTCGLCMDDNFNMNCGSASLLIRPPFTMEEKSMTKEELQERIEELRRDRDDTHVTITDMQEELATIDAELADRENELASL